MGIVTSQKSHGWNARFWLVERKFAALWLVTTYCSHHDYSQEHSWSRLQNKQTIMNINYGLFFSFRNISDRNREEYDLKKHQGQNIWKGNRYRLIVGENKPRILTFSRRRQNRLNGVLGETRTARTRVWASCAHASLCKFTSGSRRSLSRPRILRSLMFTLETAPPSCRRPSYCTY